METTGQEASPAVTTKTCTKCKTPKLANRENFNADKDKKDGLTSWCKTCRAGRHREYCNDPAIKAALAAYQRARYNKAAQAEYHRLRLYRLTPEAYLNMLQEQGNKCAGCRGPFSDTNVPHVDHDHSCCAGGKVRKECGGKCVRGLLCDGCNKGIGLAKDNPAVTRAWTLYLEGYQTNPEWGMRG